MTVISLNTKPHLKPGDRVRVMIEGEVKTHSESTGYLQLIGDKNKDIALDTLSPYVHSIEIVKPPVVQFKPGQTVRENRAEGDTYLLAHEGFINLKTNRVRLYSLLNPKDYFTSENFTVVEA